MNDKAGASGEVERIRREIQKAGEERVGKAGGAGKLSWAMKGNSPRYNS